MARLRRLDLGKGLVYAVTLLICGLVAFPIYWMVLTSLRGSGFPSTSLVPDFRGFTFEAYRHAFDLFPFATWYRNSVIVSVTTTAISLVVAMFSAYSLARFEFKGRSAYGLAILLSQALPAVLIAVPLFSLLADLHLINTYPGLVFAYVARALPFSIWMLWGFFQNLPRELEEAAQLDGLSRPGTLFRVVFPLAAPGIAAVMLFTFVLAWEEYLMSLMVMSSEEKVTLTVGAARLVGGQAVLWGELMAYSTMMTLPVAVIFALAQRYLVAGMTAGAMK
jgi:ABC-type glycerol-3-phosphate transport system permease component